MHLIFKINMKKLFYILFLSALLPVLLHGQNVLDNNKASGKIINNGTIKVMDNRGVKGLPDTLGGRMEFLSNVIGAHQYVPNITYYQLVIDGQTKKDISYNPSEITNYRPLRTLDSLIVKSPHFVILDSVHVEAKGFVGNNSDIRGRKQVIMNHEDNDQDVTGKGRFSNLTIDNPQGVDVINGGGFAVRRYLRLNRGTLRNSAQNNFSLADSATIIRTPQGALASAPAFEGGINVHYQGSGKITAGPEIPGDESTLRDLIAANSDSLVFNKNATVNDSLYVGTRVTADEDTLTYASSSNPVFDENNPDSEVIGAFKRTSLPANDTLYFNNPFTYVYFPGEIGKGDIAGMTSYIRPNTFPTEPGGNKKVERLINLTAFDSAGGLVTDGFVYDLGYGWRYSGDPETDEVNDLKISRLILQNWNEKNQKWDALSSEENKITEDSWIYSSAERIERLGSFAIGLPFVDFFVFRARFYLEGAYDENRRNMRTTLNSDGLLYNVQGDKYPYNLLSDLNIPEDIPDSVVDWVVLEFREGLFEPASFYKPAFITRDGILLDMQGKRGIKLDANDENIQSNSAEFNIVIRHRNHMPIVTKDLKFDSANSSIVYDFRTSDVATYIEGGRQALSTVDEIDGKRRYAIPGGFDYNQDVGSNGLIEIKTDERYFIDLFNSNRREMFDGYVPYDFNMNSTLTTKDFNLRWNNRGKVSNVREIK